MKKLISIMLASVMLFAVLPTNALGTVKLSPDIMLMDNEELQTSEPLPTVEVTVEATIAPTETPTPVLTEEPTPVPTVEATVEPTVEPTEEPTETPTEKPTEEPTEEPTEKPTEKPTEEPTEKPTEKPTEEPTEEPTPTPTPTPVPTPTPELKLVSTSKYREDGTSLYGVAAKTKASEVIANFVPGNISIVNSKGRVLGNSETVGTGASVQLADGEKVIDKLTVIIAGDVNGDGSVDANDTAKIQEHIEKKTVLLSSFFEAANIVSDSVVNTKDILALQGIISASGGNASAVALPNTVKFDFSADTARPGDEITVTVSIVAASNALHAFEIYIPVTNEAFTFTSGSDQYLISLDKDAVGGSEYLSISKNLLCNYSDITTPLSGETAVLKFKAVVNSDYEGGKTTLEFEADSFALDGKGNALALKCESDTVTVYADSTEFEYTVENEKATITAYKGSGGDVEIPDTVSGFPVVAIADGVFENNMAVETVTFGENVEKIGERAFYGCGLLTGVNCASSKITSIGAEAFYGCARLRSVSLPTTLVSIGDYAFYGCSGIVTLALPDSLVSIGKYAFCGCSSMVNINIPKNVNTIGYRALSGCTRLRTVTVSAANTVFASVDGMLCNAAKNTLILCPAGKSGEVTVPATVTAIEASAFEGCADISRVDLPEGLMSIGDEAFVACSSLQGAYFHGAAPSAFGSEVFASTAQNFTVYCVERHYASFAPNGETTYKGYPLAVFDDTPEPTAHPDYEYRVEGENAVITGYKGKGGYIEIPSMMLTYPVTAIANSAFANNTAITGATVPDSVVSIGARAFEGCSALATVTLSNGVQTIGEYAFARTGINVLNLTDSVVSIGKRAFEGCEHMTEAVISSSVKNIDGNVFAYSSSLTQITVQGDNRYYSASNGVLYDKNKTRLIACGAGKSGSVSVAATASTIGEYAFAGCRKLTRISLGALTQTIEAFAFDGCTGLMAFEVSAFNSSFVALDGMLYTANKQVFVACPAGKAGSSSVADGTTAIAANAFNSSALTSIALPESITDIYEYAFSDCTRLESIIIPENTVMIGNGAFSGCTKLKSAYFYGKPPAAFGNSVFDAVASGFTIYYLEWNKSYWSPSGAQTYKGYPIAAFAVLRLNEKSLYTAETKYSRIKGISEGTTVETFISNFVQGSIRVVDSRGNIMRSTNLVATGYRVQLLDSYSNVMDELNIVVNGDATGDASIDSRDIAAIQNHILERRALNGVYLNAADTTNDGNIKSNDLVLVLKHIIGIKPLSK